MSRTKDQEFWDAPALWAGLPSKISRTCQTCRRLVSSSSPVLCWWRRTRTDLFERGLRVTQPQGQAEEGGLAR